MLWESCLSVTTLAATGAMLELSGIRLLLTLFPLCTFPLICFDPCECDGMAPMLQVMQKTRAHEPLEVPENLELPGGRPVCYEVRPARFR